MAVTDMENKPLEAEHMFRGVLYRIKEVPIGRFDEIQKAATKQILDSDGNVLGERLDSALQMRMLVAASVIEPAGLELGTLPASVVFALNTAVNKLHDPAVDELPNKKATTTGATEADGEATGKE